MSARRSGTGDGAGLGCASAVIAVLAILTGPWLATPAAAAAERVTVTGELVDSWCTISGVMGYAQGTAHFQCAVWCAVGGIPVSIKTADESWYVILKVGEDGRTVSNPRSVVMQAHKVTVEGDLLRRDGVNYLLVDQVLTDEGVVDLSHRDYGIIPFGE